MLNELINIDHFYHSFKESIYWRATLCQAVLRDIIYLFAYALFIFLSRIEKLQEIGTLFSFPILCPVPSSSA